MSDYHGRIMNLPVIELIKKNDTKNDYLRGHRDARHAAAEIAGEADRQIEAAEALAEALGRLLASGGATVANRQLAERALAAWEAAKGAK